MMDSSGATNADKSLEEQYMEAKQLLRESKRKNREQSKRARQLMAAVAAKLQEKEEEIVEVTNT